MSEALRIKNILDRYRFPLTNEKRLQADIATVLKNEGIPFVREYRLSSQDIVDFFSEGVAIEVKIKSPRASLYDQCVRYCKHDEVKELLLVTNVATGWPAEIEGKPACFMSLSRSWL